MESIKEICLFFKRNSLVIVRFKCYAIKINHQVVYVTFSLRVCWPTSTNFCYYQVNKTFAGSYELILYSTIFGETKIPFEIKIIDQSSTTQSPFTTQPTYMARDQAVVVACAVLGALVAVATAILLVKIYLKKKEIGSL